MHHNYNKCVLDNTLLHIAYDICLLYVPKPIFVFRHASRTSTHPSKSVYLYNHAYALSDENCQRIEDLPTLCGNSYHSAEQMFVFKSFEGYE